jgi:hypothetical protein
MLLLLFSVGLAAGLAVVAYAESVALDAVEGMGHHMDSLIATRQALQAADDDDSFKDSCLVLQLVKQILPTRHRLHHWWTSAAMKLLDFQLRDFALTAGTLLRASASAYGAYVTVYQTRVTIQLPDVFQPLLCAMVVICLSRPCQRFSQQARIIAAVCLVSRVLSAHTSLLPPDCYRFVLFIVMMTFLWAQPSDCTTVWVTYACIHICGFLVYIVLVPIGYLLCAVVSVACIVVAAAWFGMVFTYKAAMFTLRLIWCGMWFVVSGNMFLQIGAIEAAVADDLVRWWKSSRAKQKQARHTQSSSKPQSRISLWNLFSSLSLSSSSSSRHPADSRRTDTAAAGPFVGSNSKIGKRGSKRAVGATRKNDSSAYQQHAAAAAPVQGGSNMSHFSSSDTDLVADESLAQLLTLPSVARLQAIRKAAAAPAAAAGGAAAAKTKSKQGGASGKPLGHALKSAAGHDAFGSSSSSSSRPTGNILYLHPHVVLLRVTSTQLSGATNEGSASSLSLQGISTLLTRRYVCCC